MDSHLYRYISDMSYMFYNCISLVSINLENFITSNYLSIDLSYMFYNCQELETITFNLVDKSFGINKIDYMFYNCSKLSEISLRSFNSFYDLNMSYLFYNCQSLTKIDLIDNYFKVIDTRQMFYNCTSLEQLTFYPYAIKENINMSKMFYNCNKLQNITFKKENSYFEPNDMSSMFYNCTSLLSLDLNKFKSTYLEYISYVLYNCTNLINFNISSSDFSNELIKDMRGIFQNCESIELLDLTTFHTPNVEIMWNMFSGCSKLKYLYIENFDTSKVTDMQSMFSECKSLETLNLSHFNTTNVQYMNKMFQNCENLQQLNFSQLTSDSLSSMYRMFYNCKSLEYLNIFYLIDDAQSIIEMFEGTSINFTICIKEEENIPNIYNSIYDKIIRDCSSNCYGIGNERNSTQNNKSCCSLYEYNNKCYNKCPKKTKIQDSTNICKKFNCNNFYNYEQDDCSDNITGFYKNDTDTIDKCHKDCKTCENGPNDYSTNCLICNDDKTYLYFGNCYTSCRYGDFVDTKGIKKCKCHREKCKECTKESLKYDLCILCNEEGKYYEKSNDNINISNFKNCYKEPEEYYLNSTEKKYLPCFNSCKFCFPLIPDKRHHYCKSCNDDNTFSILDENNPNYTNCYPECKYKYYFDSDYNYKCTNTSECPQSYPFLIENTKQCIERCNDTHKWQFRHTCFEQCPLDSKNYTNETGFYCNASCPFERPFLKVQTQYCVSSCNIMERYNKLCFTNYEGNRNNEIQDLILNDFKDDVIDTFNYAFITKKQNLIYEEKNIIYEITSTSTQCTYQDPLTTTIDLGDCESILKDYYGIGNNKTLYIFKIDAFVEGKIGPKVEYEIYYHFDTINLHQLDLSICEGKKIFIGYPINITKDELDLYNSNSSYYSDICYPYTNSKGTDVTLNDRQIEYINNNKSLCEENCKVSGYDEENGRLICSCEVKHSISMISQIKIDKDNLYNFIDLKQMVNFKVMKCIKLLFSIKGFKTNIGFYSFFPTIIAYIVALIILWLIEFKRISNQINDIFSVKKIMKLSRIKKKFNIKNDQKLVGNLINKNKLQLATIKEETIQNPNQDAENIDNDIQTKNRQLKDSMINKKSEEKIETMISSPPLKENNKEKNITIKFKKENSEQENDISDKNLIEASYVLKLNKLKKYELTLEEKIKISEILNYNDNELNDLGYKKAFQHDHRTFLQYYISLLFTKHIIFQIFNKRDYNSYSIKVLLLFFNFSSCFAINALFFNDNTMHQIYEDEGVFNFIYQLPQIAYSTLISYFIDGITSFLALSEDIIIRLKQNKKFHKLNEKKRRIKNILKIKFIFFFIVNIIFILFFWYYLSCFCAVYKNTQYHLIKDTLISFSIGYITPFGTNIITAFIRFYSLKRYNKKNRMLFRLSKLLQKYL